MNLIENKEVQDIILQVIESIFDYENESGSKIIDYQRTSEDVQKMFIENYNPKKTNSNMKEINLDSEIREIFAYQRFADKYDLNIRQFDYYEMLKFAKIIADKTVEVCAENYMEGKTVYINNVSKIIYQSGNKRILNTKNKIK